MESKNHVVLILDRSQVYPRISTLILHLKKMVRRFQKWLSNGTIEIVQSYFCLINGTVSVIASFEEFFSIANVMILKRYTYVLTRTIFG